MGKTTIDSKGVVTSKDGSGIEVLSVATFTGGTQRSVTAITSATTLTKDGVYTISGSTGSGVITVTLPDPATVIGGHFILRSLSADAHLLSSSQVTQDTLTITDGTNHGARLALPAVIGSSAMLVSDGVNFLVPVSSGTYIISTPTA